MKYNTMSQINMNEKNKYLIIFENIPNPIILLDRNNCIDNMNHAASVLLESLRLPDADYYNSGREAKETLHWLANELMTFTSHGDVLESRFEKELEIDGDICNFEIRLVRILDSNKKYDGTIVFLNDITERKQAEEAFRISEAKLSLITNNIIDMVSRSDSNLTYQYVSPSHKSILGYEPEDLLGKCIFYFMHPKDITAVKMAIRTKSPGMAEFRYRHANGHYIWLESTFNPLVEDGQFVGFIHVRRDITDHKEIQEKVKNYQEQLRSLATKLTLVEQEERRRIASDLHDHIGQYLAIAKLELDSLRESLTKTDLIEAVTVIGKLIEKTIQYTRTLIFEISSPVLYELGFEARVKWLGEELIEKRGIKLVFNSDKQPVQMSEEISVILFTAVRELLVNVVKHARASLVSIYIQKRHKDIQVSIYDDGKGFVISKKHIVFGKTNGFGLFSMSERLKHLGGLLKIESEPGKGTSAVLRAPLKF